jgi:F420-0:gamma-glutamyl ligase-like protein
MTEPDVLSRKIHELKEWQRVAWRRVADPLLTVFERREIRNHIRESETELRRCLEMMSERLRFQARKMEEAGDSLARFNFRLFA